MTLDVIANVRQAHRSPCMTGCLTVARNVPARQCHFILTHCLKPVPHSETRSQAVARITDRTVSQQTT